MGPSDDHEHPRQHSGVGRSERPGDEPTPPDLPAYLIDPLTRQSPERLEQVAAYAQRLAAQKRRERQRDERHRQRDEEVTPAERADLEERGVSTDPDDYDGVPTEGAYITVKTTKQTTEKAYRYYYWQWREGDEWKNSYIAPVQEKSS